MLKQEKARKLIVNLEIIWSEVREKMDGLDLFTGIGGITIALKEYVTPVAYCEIEPYCQSVILQRMQEGNLPKAPIWDDIRTLSTKELPKIDIIYGGFPCTDISIAGLQRGLAGKQSGLIFEVFRLIDETKAPIVFFENVPNIRLLGAERICKMLAERGYDSRWCCLSASNVGALHKRERWFLLAYATSKKCYGLSGRTTERQSATRNNGKHKTKYSWRKAVSNVCRTSDGIPLRMDRLRILGNSVVPQCVEKAFETLIGL